MDKFNLNLILEGAKDEETKKLIINNHETMCELKKLFRMPIRILLID